MHEISFRALDWLFREEIMRRAFYTWPIAFLDRGDRHFLILQDQSTRHGRVFPLKFCEIVACRSSNIHNQHLVLSYSSQALSNGVKSFVHPMGPPYTVASHVILESRHPARIGRKPFEGIEIGVLAVLEDADICRIGMVGAAEVGRETGEGWDMAVSKADNTVVEELFSERV